MERIKALRLAEKLFKYITQLMVLTIFSTSSPSAPLNNLDLVQDQSGPGVEIIIFLYEALKYIFNMYWFQLEKKYFPSTRINRSDQRATAG